MNSKPRNAWELYLSMDTSPEAFSLLQLIANDCYKMGQFFYAARAFDVLEHLDPNPEYWEGKRGACVGMFQMVIAGKEPKYEYMNLFSMSNCRGFQSFTSRCCSTFEEYSEPSSGRNNSYNQNLVERKPNPYLIFMLYQIYTYLFNTSSIFFGK